MGTDLRTVHRWLERRRETIVPVPYFHLVFTLPSELHAVVAMNRARMFSVMFEAASKTVLTLSRDNKRLGATTALTIVLHTCTRDLRFHPHIHAVVCAVAMNEQGQWVHKSRQRYHSSKAKQERWQPEWARSRH